MIDIFKIKRDIKDNNIVVTIKTIGDITYVLLEDEKSGERACIGEIKKQEEVG